jgi:hypothetical protein
LALTTGGRKWGPDEAFANEMRLAAAIQWYSRGVISHELPVWELRVGVFRVFYDVAEDEKRVHIRAVRRKESQQRTEDVV